jgi:hypothetical protein
MPLENLVGNKYISDLNPNWPAGTDLPDAGDDHLRGIKNVLQKTFPNINGPVTLSDEELNRGSVPAGSVVPFYMSAAPVGWSRTPGFTQTFGLRIVASNVAGGGSGGSDDPILMDKVPSHTHTFSAATGGNSVDHSHAFSGTSGYMNQNASHNHGISDPGHSHGYTGLTAAPGQGYGSANPYFIEGARNTGAAVTGISIASTDTNHTHSLSGNTGGASQSHTHSVSGSVVANASAANWVPRYVDVIMCTKD